LKGLYCANNILFSPKEKKETSGFLINEEHIKQEALISSKGIKD
jgi:hypothetical protein